MIEAGAGFQVQMQVLRVAAQAFFIAQMKRDSRRTEPCLQLGRTLVLAGDYSQAVDVIEPLLDSDDFRDRAVANDELALIDLYRGRFEDAVRRKAMARDIMGENGGGSEEVARRDMQLGYIQTKIGEFDAAAEEFARARQQVPDVGALNLDILHLAALADIERGRLHAAGETLRVIGDAVFEQGLTAQLRRFYQLDAEMRIRDGHATDALISLPRAIAIYDHPLYRETQARALLSLDRLAEAEEALRRIIELTDARLDIPIAFVRTHYQLASIYESQGKTQQAARLYAAFLDYWGKTDSPMAEVRDARDALDRLTSAE